ncbi:MAG TPA: redoxin domain-containing protein [Allosphingosinicella sp.]|nr:redoxin domain-containing protein [Allosphingosinicella sp.]
MMATDARRSRIPDVSLQRIEGGEINPSALIGQKLVVLFCPAELAAAVREIEDYRALANDFKDHGVWILGILAEGMGAPRLESGDPSIALTRDKDGAAWAAFASFLQDTRAGRAEGATFLFEQWGCFGHAWTGTGHAIGVLAEARRRN